MTIENLKDKLQDKIEIYVCEEEENTLIAQGMLKALGMMDEVLENAEQEPTDTWSIKDVADTLSKHGLIADQEPCEECDYSEIVDWEQDAKTGKAKPIYWCERHKEPCDDAISRQAVLKTLDDMDNVLDEDRTVENYKELLKECYEVLPSVRPQALTREEQALLQKWRDNRGISMEEFSEALDELQESKGGEQYGNV